MDDTYGLAHNVLDKKVAPSKPFSYIIVGLTYMMYIQRYLLLYMYITYVHTWKK